MEFYVRKRRQAPAIIIVALIDILIVLLIFLMVTTTFKQQPALKLALPESAHAEKSGAQENAPAVVTVDPQGNLRFGPESKPMTLESLKAALSAEVGKNADLRLAINTDKTAPVGQIVKIMDLTKELGIKNVYMFTREPAKQ